MDYKKYFVDKHDQGQVSQLWAQMFFEDGSVSPGKLINSWVYLNKDGIKDVAQYFLEDMNRRDGVIVLWGAGVVYAKRAKLSKNNSLRLYRI